MLPMDGGRDDFGSHFVSLFAKGLYVYGQLLTEIPRSDAKMIVLKVYFQENSLRSSL